MTTPNVPILQKGDNGDAVRFLEQLLSSIFWFGNQPGNPSLVKNLVTFDGNYDDECKAIVEEFQANYNTTFPVPAPDIDVDGIVGPQTWQALGDSIFKYTY